MRILAIESSALTASVAIADGDTLVAEYTINHKKTHSQTILPMIDAITEITETDCGNIDLIAVSNGPGSFTGLRIGAATGKGLALALNKPMVAVPTLEAMAFNLVDDKRLICPVMDAKRKHLYSGLYYFDNGKLVEKIKQCLISYEDLTKQLNELDCEVVFLGDGIDVAEEYFRENLSCRYSFAPLHIRTQRAGAVAFAAMRMYEEGRVTDSDNFSPDYLRPSQAEREHDNKSGGAEQ